MAYLINKACLHGCIRLRKGNMLDEKLQKDMDKATLDNLVKRGVLVNTKKQETAKKESPKKQNTQEPAEEQKTRSIPMWGYNPADLVSYSVEELNAIVLDTMEKAGLLEEYHQNQLLYIFTDKDTAIEFMTQHYKA